MYLNLSRWLTRATALTLSAIVNLGASVAFAATYYAAPTGSSTADGSISSPWDLQTALNKSLAPGDTLFLRGGTYKGTFTSHLKGTSTSPVHVKQYPGEAAKLDGGNSNHVAIFTVAGTYTWFWDFEITSSDFNRVSSSSSSQPTDIGRGEGVLINQDGTSGTGCKFIHLVIHDTAQGHSFWKDAQNAELYGNLIFYNGWDGPSGDRGHGHGIYTQNQNGTKTLDNNFVFRQFGMGISQYGSGTSYIQNYKWDNNVIFNNGEPSIFGFDRDVLIGGLSGAACNNNVYNGNVSHESVNKFGYTGTCTGSTVTNNYIWADGNAVETTLTGSNTFTGNTFAGSVPAGAFRIIIPVTPTSRTV